MAEVSLLERLRVCELLSAEQLAELEGLPEAANPDPKALARVVFQRGWLTKFQLSQVAAGKGKDLLVGPYLLLDKLGEGGMGQVLKARHRHMKRVVALKLIRKEKLGGADNVARFYQEVEAAAQLHHPNIVLAFDAGQAGGTHFFAMEYVEGPDLTRLVREKGTLPVAQACEFIRQAAIGLQHAHERGLVHRDIKPSNLLVTASAADPVVKILDLGLARLGDSFAKERNLTKMGQVIGTPDYLAPEQALDARNVDIRADIYSLGCSLYFLLTARAPFEAESLTELLMKHQMNDPTPIRSLRPDVPAALEALLRRMLAKKAQDRPDTPAEVAAELEPFARGGQGNHEDAPPPVSISAPKSARSDETWAGLSNDGEVVARPKARASRNRDTIDEEPRPRRKKEKEKGNKGLLIGGAIGAGVLVLALIAGVVALVSPKKAEKVVEKQPVAQAGQERPVVVPPVQPDEDPPADGAAAAIERAVRQGKMTRTAQAGGGGGGNEEYADLAPNGAWLTGLEVGTGKWGDQDVVYYLRPIYRSPAGRSLGKMFGTHRVPHNLEAKPGYAVGGITINAGAGLDGLSVKFMAIKGAALDPADSYESYWVGGKGGVQRSLGGDGSPIVGLFGKLDGQPTVANGLGLVLLSNGRPAPPSPAGDSERLIGGGFGGEVYRDVAPEGGLLVGVEVGLGKFGKDDVTQSLRPIFRTGDKETKGPQRGTKLDRVKTLLAKPGYAVGAMSVRYGANADGLSLTFMRIKGDALDPADFEESEWVGDPRPQQPKTLLTGGGRPVVGLSIKAKPTDVTGYGLILRPGGGPAPGALAGEVRQFPVTAGKPLRGLYFHFDGKRGIAYFDPVGVTLDPTTGQQADFYRINSNRVLAITASKDGKRILIADGKRIRLMDLENGKEVQALEMAPDAAPAVRIAMSADGKFALTVPNNTQSVVLWNLETGKLDHTFADLGGPVRSCAITDDGRYAVATNDWNKTLRVWDIKTKALAHTIVKRDLRMQSHVLVAPVGGSEMLVNGEDGNLTILDCATGKEVRKFDAPPSRYRNALVVSADRKTAVTIGGYDGRIGTETVKREVEMQVWDVAKGKRVASVELPAVPKLVAVSPDGKSALVADNQTIRYFDLTKLGRDDGAKSPETPRDPVGAEVRRFSPPVGTLVNGLSFLRDGKTGLAVVGPAAYALDPATGKRTEAFRVSDSQPVGQSVSKDGKYLLRGDADGRLRLIDVETGKVVKSAGDANYHTWAPAVALSPDRKLALSCPDGRRIVGGQPARGPDGKVAFDACDVCLWDLDTGKLEHRFTGSDAPSQPCAFTDDGRYVIASNPKIPLRVWEVKTKKLVHTVSADDPGSRSRANLLVPAGGSDVLVSCHDGSLTLFDCATGKDGRRIENPIPRIRQSISLTADNKTAVVTEGANGNDANGKPFLRDTIMRVLDISKGVEVARVPFPTMPSQTAVSPDGRFALVAEFKVIHYFDLAKLRGGDGTKPPDPSAAPAKSDAVEFVGHTGTVNGVALSPDGTRLVSGGEDGSVRLWESATGKPLRPLREPNANQGSILAVKFTPDGKRVLALDENRRVSNWQMKTDQWTGSTDAGFRLPSGDAPGFDISPTNDFLALPAGKTFIPLRLGSGQMMRERTQPLAFAGLSVASVGEGNAFAVGDAAGAVRLVDPSAAKPTLGLPIVPHKEAVLALVYNPKSKHLFSGSADKTIKRTPLRTGTKPAPRAFASHDGAVTCLAVSRDGKWLASGSKDKTVRVWDVATRKELYKFTDDDAIRGVGFSADGKSVYSAGKSLRMWPLVEAKKEAGKEPKGEGKP